MLEPLRIGTVFVQTEMFIPDSVSLQKRTFCPGWQRIMNLNGDDLDRQIRSAGWNFIFLGGALQGSSWASWSDTAIRCAALRVLKKSRTTRLNAFEITGIHARRFLGVRYVVMTGHSRHLQKSTVLQSLAERIHRAARIVPSSPSDEKAVVPVPASAMAK